MSTYDDLIAVIRSLPPNSNVTITADWCRQHGLIVNESLVKEWGRRLHKEYTNHNLIYVKKGSNNLNYYQKK